MQVIIVLKQQPSGITNYLRLVLLVYSVSNNLIIEHSNCTLSVTLHLLTRVTIGTNIEIKKSNCNH